MRACLFLPVVFAAETHVAKVLLFTDDACATAASTAHQYHILDSCVKETMDTANSWKAECTSGTVTKTRYTDEACATKDTVQPDDPLSSTCTKQMKLEKCEKMDCSGADKTAMTCTAMSTTKKNNSSSDNAVTASMAGAVVVSAAALAFA
jgi:hypothetical protein